MKKRKIILISVLSVIFVLLSFTFIILLTNKTFFKTTYIGVENQKIFIPRYSYFKEECCMTGAYFYSLRSQKKLQEEIDNYMHDFEYFEDDSTHGYMKAELFIQSYVVVDNGLYRKIIIIY